PKLQVGCTQAVAEGMVVHTDSDLVKQARKGTLEFLLTNHPLDCPVCDKGGECELQDMAFRYGAGESRFTERKVHVDEKQWSPVVFFDAPRCILCYRCVRVCDEGIGVKALGVGNRGVIAEIIPNRHDHLECDECGACIDICPVGALTSGIYRYQTRPWEMDHVGTICTHCADGCRTTLGVRNEKIIRGNNRDRSGINNEFLCVKGRYGFDFTEHPERLQSPMLRSGENFEPISWSQAIESIAARFTQTRVRGGKFGIIGSNHTTNEENFFLAKFARQGLGTKNIDHHRTGDLATLFDALSGRNEALATTADLYRAKSVLIIASDLSQQHPLLAFQARASVRHHAAHIYTVTPGPVREEQQAAASVHVEKGGELAGVESLRDKLKSESELVIVFGDAIQGETLRKLIAFGDSLGVPVKYVCLVDYSNSRGAFDMGLVPRDGGLSREQMLAANDLDVLWVVGANPLKKGATLASSNAFVVVQDLFLTETARHADIVLPAASAYEKSGTVTNVCGEVQKLKRAGKVMGAKTDLEIFGMLAKEMDLHLGIWLPDKVFEEIRRTVHGYNVPPALIATGGAAPTAPLNGRVASLAGVIESSGDTLFTSGSISRYSKILNSVMEAPGALYHGEER
ncbi:MAG TPA: molybdopterin-dependent oxidoreductase, partial [Bryobacteraceae bacterium]|nr:molybdopterin-dependent oxidoreductase [Bryobacteraceae bacterium]